MPMMMHNQLWIYLLLGLNIGLAIAFFSLSWWIVQLYRHLNMWTNHLTRREQHLAFVLTQQPERLSNQVETIKQLQRNYHRWQLNLKRLQQMLTLIQFLSRTMKP